jgi:hypothetical protein
MAGMIARVHNISFQKAIIPKNLTVCGFIVTWLLKAGII